MERQIYLCLRNKRLFVRSRKVFYSSGSKLAMTNMKSAMQNTEPNTADFARVTAEHFGTSI